MGAWRQALGVFIENIEAEIESLRMLTHGERELVQARLLPEASVPALPERTDLYTFTNALTAAAREAEPARRLELENHAGEFLVQRVRS